MKKIFIALICFLFSASLYAQNYPIGHLPAIYLDTARSNRAVSVEIFYPGLTAGDSVACAQSVDGTKFPIIIFAPGQSLNYLNYSFYVHNFVPRGFAMVFLNYDTGVNLNIPDYARDIEFMTKKIKEIANIKSLKSDSVFVNNISDKSCLMGHSLGGKAVYLSVKSADSLLSITNINGIVTFAAAGYDEALQQASSIVNVPHLVFAAALDSYAPIAANQNLVYNNSNSILKTLINIKNGTHCQFADNNPNCLLYDNNSNLTNAISLDSQLTIVKTYLTFWLDFFLKEKCEAAPTFETLLTSPAVVSTQHKTFIPSQFNITSTGDNPFCVGDSVIYDLETDAVFVQWSDGDVYRRKIIKDNVTLTVKAWNFPACYRESDAVSIITYDVPEKPVVKVDGNLTFCEGDSVELYLDKSYNSIKWSTGETTPGIIIKTPQKICVTVSNANNCTNISDTVEIHIVDKPISPSLVYEKKSLCQGDSLILTCSGNYANYLWSTGEKTKSILIKGTGKYWLNVDNNYCASTSDSADIVFNPLPQKPALYIPTDVAICRGDSLVLNYNGSAARMEWSDGSSDKQLVVKAGGKYFLTVYNDQNCKNISDTVSVTIYDLPEKPLLKWNGKILSCPKAASYQWYLSNTVIPNALDSFLIPESDGSYYVKITNNNGCSINSDTLTFALGVNESSKSDNSFTVSPNPFDNILKIKAETDLSSDIQVEISNLQGELLYNSIFNTQSIEIDTKNFVRGTYFLNLRYGGNTYYYKIIK